MWLLEIASPQGFREHLPENTPLYHQDVPSTVLSVINSGVGGDSAQGATRRLERDVISFDPDFVTIAFGINDSLAGREGLEQYTGALESMVDCIRHATEAEIIFITPNMMLTHENPNVHAQHRELVEPMLKVTSEGILAAYAESMRVLVRKLQVPVVDVFAAWKEWERQGKDINQLLANGMNHPDVAGHRLVAELLWEKIATVL